MFWVPAKILQRCLMAPAGVVKGSGKCRPKPYLMVFLLMTILFTGLLFQGNLPNAVFKGKVNETATILVEIRNFTAEMEKLRINVTRERSLKINRTFENYGNIFRLQNVSCVNMLSGAKNDLEIGVALAKKLKIEVPLINNEYYINKTVNCETFIETRGYITDHLTDEERDFPIAFSVLVYKDSEMVDRLLRAIYRPQHFYCIHVDSKANKPFQKAIAGIAKCFPNVFLSSKQISVVWGQYSVLEPEIMCMRELWDRSKKWKYFINLTGQEYPLKTNAELVKILKAYDGANDVEGTIQRANKERWRDTQPPQGIRPLKGSVHICVNRKFVDYILHNKTAIQLLNWVKKTDIPDETFFATLHHNPQLRIPGAYKGWPETDTTNRKPFLTRYKNWGAYSCAGYWTRGICILSTGDLPLLRTRPEMFANKFHLKEDRIVVGCLEEKLFNDTRDGYFGRKYFNTTFYENLGFVKDKIPVWTDEEERRTSSLRPLVT